ncbi:bifunctional 2-polyprenyl-6-hydroxyphenol methylase/3-demethylubiquinol 3-O-methyltransferase UbiG [uncultured Shewanella sp.]|uniref:class I SAM-dependent methyltransferase n=1 Tax=uncultured Shewanella sp. TaxID=173975 RepID=UPI002639641F|nr:class I SAM-dependent methyltransferase [uncultured Shewanella sp.]
MYSKSNKKSQNLCYPQLNKHAWNERTRRHITSNFYDVAGFLNGKSSLNTIEVEALGDVSHQSLLHLQCHFGLDTLSWARLGAQVTGVDLSPVAIEHAKQLAIQSGLKAHFIARDLYQFFDEKQREKSPELFDIVFTSYGVVCWLSDLNRWAQGIKAQLKPNGIFYLAEFHPINDLLFGDDYFNTEQAQIIQEPTYTENHNNELDTLAVWSHSLSEVITALLKAGIAIESFNEYPFSPYAVCEKLIQNSQGQYELTHLGKKVPLIYTIKGRNIS